MKTVPALSDGWFVAAVFNDAAIYSLAGRILTVRHLEKNWNAGDKGLNRTFGKLWCWPLRNWRIT